ncbi:MAG TPA: translocation/assembly module TamB domain-containing protein, partial [Polyangia bacterium]|nr:translocation/assembly module TamB domain-containing protein [Polyangia bacterium]
MAAATPKKTSWARRARVVTWVIVGPLLAGIAVVSLGLLYARTDHGRERVRKLAVAEARKVVPGLEVGRVEGDYLHDLRLVDVTVRDREGRATVHADAVFVRYELPPLLHHVVAVSELRVDGLRVQAVADADGRLNLTELVAPSNDAATTPKTSPTSSPPWHVHVDRLAVDGAATIETDAERRVDVTSIALVAALRLDDGARVELDRLDVRAGDAGAVSIEGTAAATRGATGAFALADYALSLRGSDLDPARLGLGPDGSISVAASVTGHGVPLAPDARLSLTVDVPRSELAGFVIAEAHATLAAEGERWTIARVAAKAPGITLLGNGRGQGPHIDGADVRVALEGPLPEVPTRVRGAGRLAVHASGTWPALTARIDGDVKALRVDAARVGALSIVGTLTGPPTTPHARVRVAARAIALSDAAPRLDRATLVLSDDAGALRVDADVVGPRVRGGLRAHGRATSELVDVGLDAFSLDFATRQYRQIVTLQHPTRVRFEPGQLVRWDATAIHGQGFRFTGDAVTDGTYRLTPAGRAPLAAGHLTLRHASFEGLPPVDADVALDLTSRRATMKLAARLPKTDARLSVDAAIPVVVPRGRPPRLAKTGAVAVHLDARSLRLGELPIVDKALARQGITGGVAGLALDVTGDIEHPDAKGRFDLRDVTYRNLHGLGRDSTLKTVPGLGGSLTLDTSPGVTRLRGSELIRDAGVLDVDARARIDLGRLIAGADPREAPLHASIDVPRFQLASLTDFVDELKGLSGALTAHAEIDGTMTRPTGKVDAQIANAKADAVTFKDVSLHADGDAARADATFTLSETAGGVLTAKAHLDHARGDHLTASATAHDLDLGFVRLLVPTLRETGGIAQLTARASGPLRAPAVNASLTIDKGRIGVIGQPTFHDIRVAATLAPGRADLTRLEMRSGDGTLSGTGWATLDGLSVRQAVFKAHAHRFLVAAAGATGARLDGDLALEAALKRDVIDGRVNVPRADVWLPKTPTGAGRALQKIGPHDDVRFVDGTARAAEQRSRDDAAARKPPRAVDVHVRTGSIYVRGKDLDLEVDSTLKAGRATSGPHTGQLTLAGGIHIRRGRINIQGQRFDFVRGDVTFDGGTDLNPALDIRLQRQYPDALVIVELGGTPKKPSLRLTSEPPIYDQAQVVSLILTGQP